MTNENGNNIPWKNKLENAVEWPGEILPNKEAAWQKLQQQMRQKPRRKRIVWFVASAACLLLAVAIPSVVIQKNTNGNIVKNTEPKATQPVLRKQLLAMQKDSNRRIASVTLLKKETVINNLKNERQISIGTNPIPIIADNNNAANEFTLPPSNVIDSSSLIVVATASPKKQLKVVHINELGDPVEAPQAVAHTIEPHAIELQFAREAVVTNTAVTLRKARFAFIKIKPSPSN